MSRSYVGSQQLAELRTQLSDRDMEILASLAQSRFLTTSQVQRLHFVDKQTHRAAIRSTNRALAKLRTLALIDAIERRIGGFGAGSGAYTWSLTPTGGRLLVLEGCVPERDKWRRDRDPSRNTLAHSLATAEVCVTLSEAERDGQITVLKLQREPDSWRAYSRSGGGVAYLKPDLAIVTASGEFEDHWFIEVDLASQPPFRVLTACMSYEAYRASGAEQKHLGLFPAVAWIVPTLRRKSVLRERIAAEPRLSRDLFTVVLLDELVPLMQTGMGQPEIGHES